MFGGMKGLDLVEPMHVNRHLSKGTYNCRRTKVIVNASKTAKTRLANHCSRKNLPSTTLAEQDEESVRDNGPTNCLWDKGKAHIRKVLQQKRCKHSILPKVIEILFVKSLNIVPSIF